jgi:carbamoylphosphate synthase large subunit
VVRPSFTLGGTGSSIAYNRDKFDDLVNYFFRAAGVVED